MSWPEVEKVLQQPNVIILPVGSTEQHSLHLPLDVDSRCATHIAERVAEKVTGEYKIHVLVAPTLPYTDSSSWLSFPGTMGISAETLVKVVEDITRGLLRQGFRNILILNGHYPNAAPITIALRHLESDFPDAGLYALNWWSVGFDTIPGVRKSRSGLHADELETSVYLAIRPEKVHLDKAVKDLPRYSVSERWAEPDLCGTQRLIYHTRRKHPIKGLSPGVLGDPTVASRETGEKIITAVVDDLAKIILEIMEMPPRT
ncbi:MAG: creatininase family protein [Chloroflexota bacterium]|nr:creatininase family protein [Chloroflexota bacterium]